jgi:hypothetical protein
MTGTAVGDWRPLYDAALDYRARQPWRQLTDVDVFGVQDVPGGTVSWCCVLGAEGATFGLAVFEGAEGFAGYRATVQGAEDAEYVQRGWLVTFGDRAGLDRVDLEVVKSLGSRFRGRDAWPMFRRLDPGRPPWFVSEADRPRLTDIIRQATLVAERYGDRPATLGADADGALIVRVPETHDGAIRWDERRVAPDLPAPAPTPIPPPEDRLSVERARKSPLAAGLAWECDYAYSPIVVADSTGRPCFAAPMLIVDHASGMIVHAQLGEPPLDPAFVQAQFLAAVAAAGCRPATVFARSPLTRAALEPLVGLLGFDLRRVRALPMLDPARRGLIGHFGGLR